MNKNTKAEIARIIELGADKIESGWCQHAFAKDAEGLNTSPAGNNATCFCIIGGTRAANHELCLPNDFDVETGKYTAQVRAPLLCAAEGWLHQRAQAMGYDDVPTMNDSADMTQEKVVEFMREAAKDYVK